MEEISLGQQLMQTVVPQLITALGAALALAIPVVLVWLKSKTAKLIRDNVKSDAIEKALLWANGLVMDMVAAASQTTVRELKTNLADGKITKAEYAASMTRLKLEMVDKLKDLTLGRLLETGAAETAGAVTEILSDKIEAAVPLAKAAQAAATREKSANPPGS